MHAFLPTYAFENDAEIEALSALRFELFDGQLVAITGGTLAHADLIAEVAAWLRNATSRSPCRVTSSNLRVGHDASGFRAYPDVVVRCEAPRFSPLPPAHTLINPTLVVEVTSDSTEKYDSGAKLTKYQRIDSLQTIALVSHRARKITVYERAASWAPVVYGPDDVVRFETLGAETRVDGLYDAALGSDALRKQT